jgi:hemin uptake protein HemP
LNASNQRDFRDSTRPLLTMSIQPLPPTARTISSAQLFGGEREIGIEHHGALYRLKITRQGKLILNK